MSYRLNSDIASPYGYLKPRKHVPHRNYSEIFSRKTKFAAWLVSNCHAYSKRDEFVDKMKQKDSISIFYGRCGTKLEAEPFKMISSDLRFENSLCSDYVTDKLFRYFPLDVVVIVRRGADYNK